MCTPGKLPPTPFMMKPGQPLTMARSEYNVYPSTRTAEHVARTREASMLQSRQLDIRRAGTPSVDFQKLQAYSHWRVQGDVFSESAKAKPPVQAAGKTTAICKIGAHKSGPALGYHSTYNYRL